MMTYIDYLNQFNQWLETNTLPASSQLLYYRLLHVFNRAGWPENVGIDNLRLMIMTASQSEKTAIRARERLAAAGFITCQRGRKGHPNRYTLTGQQGKYDRISARISASACAGENDSHIKTKTKTKTNSPPPPAPEEWGFCQELTDAFSDWLAYKEEKRQSYQPTGLRSLTAQVRRYADRFGENAVAALIRECMSCNWQGIIWDKLEQRQKQTESWAYDPGETEGWSL